METVTVGVLARRVGVAAGTVRYYESLGLLPQAQRSAAGYRLYRTSDASRLRFIRRAQELGFSLDEVRTLLKLSQAGGHAADVRQLTEDKIADITERIRDLDRIRNALQALAARCQGQAAVDCPILAALNGAG